MADERTEKRTTSRITRTTLPPQQSIRSSTFSKPKSISSIQQNSNARESARTPFTTNTRNRTNPPTFSLKNNSSVTKPQTIKTTSNERNERSSNPRTSGISRTTRPETQRLSTTVRETTRPSTLKSPTIAKSPTRPIPITSSISQREQRNTGNIENVEGNYSTTDIPFYDIDNALTEEDL